jgi:hypothetical protein
MECSTHQIPKPVTVIVEAGILSILKSLSIQYLHPHLHLHLHLPHPIGQSVYPYIIRHRLTSSDQVGSAAQSSSSLPCDLYTASAVWEAVHVLDSSRMISSGHSPPGGHIPNGFPSAYRGPGPVPQHSHSLQRACLPALLLWSPGLCPARA